MSEVCPVCKGTMIVPQGFYTQTSGQWSSTGLTEPCRNCGATGIIREAFGPMEEAIHKFIDDYAGTYVTENGEWESLVVAAKLRNLAASVGRFEQDLNNDIGCGTITERK